jgi:hypothetical protein
MFPNEIEGRSLISFLENNIHIFKNITSEAFGSTIISNIVDFLLTLFDRCLIVAVYSKVQLSKVQV